MLAFGQVLIKVEISKIATATIETETEPTDVNVYV